MADHTLDEILDALEHARQRATYGAVASLLGKTPRTLMKGRERAQHHSWIVNRNNGLPTGYDETLLHPELTHNEHVIDSRAELEAWLAGSALPAAVETA
jgi:hypothetical protein